MGGSRRQLFPTSKAMRKLCQNFSEATYCCYPPPLYPKSLPTNPIVLFPYNQLEVVAPVTKAVRFNVLSLDSFFSLKSLPYTRSLPQAL